MMFVELAWLIFLIPLCAIPVVAILEYIKKNAGAIVATIASGVSFVISTGSLLEVLKHGVWKDSWSWISIAGAPIKVGVYMDLLSTFMSFIVSLIGTLILIYSIEYMKHESEESKYALPRYYVEMIFFVGSMLGLVISYDLVMMYIFWEGVGLASFLLIGYWWDRPAAARGAKEAFIYTRIGDIFFLGAIVYLIFSGASDFTITTINSGGWITGGAAAVISLCLFIGAIGKSAQLPFFPWLSEKPSAMQGPTTVSALIHAATMVKAGVFLVARFYPLFEEASSFFPVLKVVAYVGGITSAFAGLVAVWKTDIKRVLGYSTISHLGFMFLALGVGASFAGLFHLLNHALFKALLFLTAGCVLHVTEEVRDMTKLGGLWNKMRVTKWLALIGAIAISGFPPFNGFWSKEAVLSGVNASGDPILFFLGIVAAMTSAFYIWRWLFLIFGREARSKEAEEAHEASSIMTGPVLVLAIGTIVSGLLIEFTGLHQVIPVLTEVTHHSHHLFSEYIVMGLSLGLAFLGIFVAYEVYQKRVAPPEVFTKNKFLRGFHRAFKNAWYFEEAYNFLGERVVEGTSKGLNWFDQHIIDGIVHGIAKAATYLGRGFRRVQTGMVEHYVTSLLIGLSVASLGLILWMLSPGVFLSILFL